MFKAVLFDLNDTLTYADSAEYKKSLEKKLALINDSRASKEWLDSISKKYFFERSTGAVTEKEYWTLALADLGIHNDKLVDKLLEVRSVSGRIFPDVKPAFKLLRSKGFLIGILANSRAGSKETVERLLSGFDVIVYSHELGFRKPHKKAYLELCTLLKVKPEECVFVSDEIYEDLWGAKRLGMKTAWVKREKRGGYFHVDPAWKVIVPDYEATDLIQIAKQICAV
ncbi:MAG: HAD family hydrolase [Candidatus Micrarchaeota archaeon]